MLLLQVMMVNIFNLTEKIIDSQCIINGTLTIYDGLHIQAQQNSLGTNYQDVIDVTLASDEYHHIQAHI